MLEGSGRPDAIVATPPPPIGTAASEPAPPLSWEKYTYWESSAIAYGRDSPDASVTAHSPISQVPVPHDVPAGASLQLELDAVGSQTRHALLGSDAPGA